eukprot:scaffold482_cov266-Amphora_coffeaeformis.AAC.35
MSKPMMARHHQPQRRQPPPPKKKKPRRWPYYVAGGLLPSLVLVLLQLYIQVQLHPPAFLGQHWRPAVAWTDARQVLIVGTLAGGTSQVTAALQMGLGLEVVHESLDADRQLTRDGTVSWFHGIRFVDRPFDELAAEEAWRLDLQCGGGYTPGTGMHPENFWDTTTTTSTTTTTQNESSTTSLLMCKSPFKSLYRMFFPASYWTECGMEQACRRGITQEWGCALRDDCATPFHTTLHQVRHPIKTVASLMAKYCNNNSTIPVVHPAFAKFPQAWFGRNFSSNSDPSTQCLLTAGWYVVNYHNAVLRSKLATTYRIEDSSPCRVAVLAGFDTTGGLLQKACRETHPTNHRPMTSTVHKRNRGRVSLTAANFTHAPDLWEELAALTRKLGYEVSPSDDDEQSFRVGEENDSDNHNKEGTANQDL